MAVIKSKTKKREVPESEKTHDKDIIELRTEIKTLDVHIRTELNRHYREDDISQGLFREKLNLTIAQNDAILKILKGDPITGEKGVIDQLKPMQSLEGFWKVIGFVMGGVALVAAGIAGTIFLSAKVSKLLGW